ncbi:MAG: GNAT family N-acetyltransferase [Anaerolineales bacterium]|nr:GNAT family N-acetyltransferase [Anaerolineales bacterium]
MELEIKILDWPQADMVELAGVALASRKASPFYIVGQDQEAFENYVLQSSQRWPKSLVLAAYQDGTLVGWLGLITEDPLSFEIWRWHPFILPGIDPGPAAEGLLHEAVNFSREKEAQSLEVVCGFQKFHLTPQAEEYYQRQMGWYEKCGLKKADEFVYLTCPSNNLHLSELPDFPGTLEIRSYQPGDQETLVEPYYQAFSAGVDRSFLEKTSEQRQTTFEGYFTEELNIGASKVLLAGDQPRGFSLIQTRQRVGDQHLALVAVSPDYQRKGWGRALLSESIRAAIGQGHDYFSIGVDLVNQAAYQLYSSLGFEVQTKLINHIWKNED